MSGTRQAWLRAARAGRWWHYLLVAVSLPVFASLGLVARLWAGPIDVTDTARRMLARHPVAALGPPLELGRVSLAWNGWQQGPQAPVGLAVEDVRLGDARIAHAIASLDLLALMHGHVSVLALTVRDGIVQLYRDRTGAVSLRPMAVERPGAPAAHRSGDRIAFDQLSGIAVTGSVFTLHDEASGLSCRADISDLLLNPLWRPAAIGMTGTIAASLSCLDTRLDLRASGREGPEGEIIWRLQAGPAVPARFAHLLPALAPLAALDLPVSLTGVTTLAGGFGRYMLPGDASLVLRLGAGSVRMQPPEEPGLAISQGELRLALQFPNGSEGRMRAQLAPSTLVLAGDADAPTLQFDGTMSSIGPRLNADLRLGIARIAFAGLQRYWPRQLAPGPHSWITSNITAGTGRNLSAVLGLESTTGLGGLRLARLSGGLDATGLTVSWLRPVPQLRGMDAHLTLEGPDALRIESRHATQDPVPGGAQRGAIVAAPTIMRITGLSQKDQLGHIETHLRGALPDMLALLSHPRLKLLSRHPLSFTGPSGMVDGRLDLQIPLLDSVTADDIPIRAEARLMDIHLGDAIVGRPLDHAELTLSATNDALKLQGTGSVGGVPATLAYSMDFRAGAPDQITETAQLSAPVTEATIRHEGWDEAQLFSGAAQLAARYQHRRSGAATVGIDLDLTGLGIATPVWSKAPGPIAGARLRIGLRNDRVVSIDDVHAAGPDLTLDAHAEIAHGHPMAIVLDAFEIGRSQGAGRIGLPGPAPLHVALHGPALDLGPYISSGLSPDPNKDTPPQAAGKGAPWRADLSFHKVMFTPNRSFNGVVLHAEAKGSRISSATLAIDGPTPLSASISPDGLGRGLAIDSPDAGGLLRALGLGSRVEGGALNVAARMEDQPGGMRLTGLAKIGRLTIHDAPLAARLARDLSIYGFVTGAPSREIVITRCEIPFVSQGGIVRLTGARASNAALGATLRGTIDMRQDRLDLRGTIVPSYILNALPGYLPGLGKVFSPEKGGGLLAATLSMTGPIDQPAIRVNPLALLAPGILRRLLFN